MQHVVQPIEKFRGLMTQYDEVSVPLGGAISCANLARYLPDRIQRIPGLSDELDIANASGGFPEAWRVRISGTEYLMTVIVDGGGNAKIWNVTSDAEVTGATALTDAVTGLLANVWTSTYFLGKIMVANGSQAIQKIDTATTRSDVTGSPSPPVGSVILAYQGRLYVADGESVKYSDSLTTDFAANNVIATDSIPGEVLVLAINSPTSAESTIISELIIGKESGLIKIGGDPSSVTSTKDVVSDSIGVFSPHTFVSTDVGTLFLGKKANKLSVYFIPLGSQGEPQDVGQALETVLNDGSNPVQNARLSRAIFHDNFYKLFFNRNGSIVEVWADIAEFIRSQEIHWFGVHTRGAMQAPVVTTDGVLHVFEVVSATGKHLQERTDKTDSFTAADQTTTVAELDLPLNPEPRFDEKIFDLLRLYIAKEANVSGNSLAVTRYSEGVEVRPSESVSIFDSASSAGSRADIPVIGGNGASLAGHFARLKMRNTTGNRLDILRMDLEYMVAEKRSLKSSPE